MTFKFCRRRSRQPIYFPDLASIIIHTITYILLIISSSSSSNSITYSQTSLYRQSI